MLKLDTTYHYGSPAVTVCLLNRVNLVTSKSFDLAVSESQDTLVKAWVCLARHDNLLVFGEAGEGRDVACKAAFLQGIEILFGEKIRTQCERLC